ncbi:MAG: hypothetical protein ACRD0E_10890, partial [Acidimicrobiales bacterium]
MTQALSKVPVTDFSQPPPLSVPPEVLAQQQRHGINPGPRQTPDPIPPGGPYVVTPPPPVAVAPTTTTTTVPTSTPTTFPTPTTGPNPPPGFLRHH